MSATVNVCIPLYSIIVSFEVVYSVPGGQLPASVHRVGLKVLITEGVTRQSDGALEQSLKQVWVNRDLYLQNLELKDVLLVSD